jgi:hypothetical protein
MSDQELSRPGPPGEPPGTRAASIPRYLIDRAAQGLRALMRGPEQFSTIRDNATPPPPTNRPVQPPEVPASATAASPVEGSGYMGPGVPQRPAIVEWSEVAGRAFDYQPGINLDLRPRGTEGITFEMLRNLSRNYDLLRLAIETRKNQLAKLGWSILPRLDPGEQFRRPADESCRAVETCLRRPDGVNAWPEWIRMIAEDSFVCDGVAIFRRRNADGKPYALEVVDPGTIKLLIDVTGRRPLPPTPAYSHVIKGMPLAQYTTREMSYWIRNPSSDRVYGYGEVEQIIRTVMIGLARMAKQLGHYNGSNIPDAMLPMPPNWNPAQIAEFERHFLQMMQNPGMKRRVHFIPGGVGQPILNSTEQTLFGGFDEWLARIVCYAFSLPPFPFVQQTNRATAQTQYDAALEEGLAPFLASIKAFIDHEIAEFFGFPDLELVWDDVRKLDPAEQANQDQVDMKSGLASVDDVRAKRGLDPAGLSEPLVFGVGPMGFLSVKQIQAILEDGSNMPPSPEMLAMQQAGMGGMPGDDPLADADPALLEQLGIDPQAAVQGAGVGGGAVGRGTGAAPSLAQIARTVQTPPAVKALLAGIASRTPAGPAEEPPEKAAPMTAKKPPPKVAAKEEEDDGGA